MTMNSLPADLLCGLCLVVPLLLAMALVTNAAGAKTSARILLKGGKVYDGTGAAGREGDVLIEGDAVAAVGPDIEAEGAEVIDVSGLVVCPGFIDVHNHTHEDYDAADTPESRRVLSSTAQGVTTLVVGMDGAGETDIAKYAEKIRVNPRSVNIARLVGHSAVRYAVLVGSGEGQGGEEFTRPATREQIAQMAALVDRAMKDGAFGLSSGLEYLGGYVTTEEVIALAKAVAPRGGYYETHLRNEDVGAFEAAEEAIRICREAGNIPLCISHIKVSFASMLGKAPEMLEIIGAARAEGMKVYSNWRSSIQWSSDLKGLDKDGKRDLPAIDAEIRGYWPKADAYLWQCPSHPELVGRTLDGIAEEWNATPAEALVKIWDFGDARFEFNAMIWEDKKTFLLDPYCMVSSDGADGLTSRRRDPQIWSCFPVFFGRMVRDRQWLPMETAVYKCTGLPAGMLGLSDRGVLRDGMRADIVVFDLEKIDGEEHWDKADTPPTGIAYVFGNGAKVMDHGEHTGEFPGRFLRRPD
ncbi:MAG: N-acyl-D-amino-acid deacylase family protein [Planctomycetota bacterium]